MKRILLTASVLFSVFGFSQIALTRHNGTPVNSGQVVAFNTNSGLAAEFDFYVKNLSATAPVNVKINCTSLVNTDGLGFELCFGNECLPDVEEGMTYPINFPHVTIPPLGQTGNDGHFLNTPFAANTAPFPKDYSFRFFQAGNPSGNTIDVTYRFDPNLSADEIDQLQTSGVIIKSTIVENELVLDVLKGDRIALFDMNGKQVFSGKLNYGIQTIDLSDLNSGVYVVSFTSVEGNTTTKKIIKK